jgi:cyanophycinase
MMGYLVLEGGAEFGGAMHIPDRFALELAGGMNCRVRIIPTAAAPDRNHAQAGRNGVTWFRSLGVEDVQVIDLIDRQSAGDAGTIAALAAAQMIYILGGFPGYLADVLANSEAWQAVLHVFNSGGVLAGSSAGAMVLCAYYFDPIRKQVRRGLRLVDNACILPHHDTFGRQWAPVLAEQLPGVTLIGIDEQTGLIGPMEDHGWTVQGRGTVMLYQSGKQTRYQARETLRLF